MDKIREEWDAKAQLWDRQIGDRGDFNRQYNIARVLWDWLGDIKGLNILDAGCGTGYLSRQLAAKGARVTGIDLAEAMVQVAKQKHPHSNPATFTADNLCNIKTVPKGSIDKAVSIYVLQDLPDLDAAVLNLYKILKPAGEAIVVFTHPCFNNENGRDWFENGLRVTWTNANSYLDEKECTETWRGTDLETRERFDWPGEFTFFHRPLRTYFKSFLKAGFSIIDFDELAPEKPYPAEFDEERAKKWRLAPYPVAYRLQKPT